MDTTKTAAAAEQAEGERIEMAWRTVRHLFPGAILVLDDRALAPHPGPVEMPPLTISADKLFFPSGWGKADETAALWAARPWEHPGGRSGFEIERLRVLVGKLQAALSEHAAERAEADERAAEMKAERDTALARLAGAEERGQIMLRAKNYWRDRLLAYGEQARIAMAATSFPEVTRQLLRSLATDAPPPPADAPVWLSIEDARLLRGAAFDRALAINTLRASGEPAVFVDVGKRLDVAIREAARLTPSGAEDVGTATRDKAAPPSAPSLDHGARRDDDRTVRITLSDAEACRRLAVDCRWGAHPGADSTAAASFYGDLAGRLGDVIQDAIERPAPMLALDGIGIPNDLEVTIRGDHAVAIASAMTQAAAGQPVERAGELAAVLASVIRAAKQRAIRRLASAREPIGPQS